MTLMAGVFSMVALIVGILIGFAVGSLGGTATERKAWTGSLAKAMKGARTVGELNILMGLLTARDDTSSVPTAPPVVHPKAAKAAWN